MIEFNAGYLQSRGSKNPILYQPQSSF